MDHVQADDAVKGRKPFAVAGREIRAHERGEIRGDHSAQDDLAVNGGENEYTLPN